MIVAEIICHNKLIIFLNERLNELQFKNKSTTNIEWTASKNALIELVYALHLSRATSENNISGLAHKFESIFNIDLGDFHNAFHKMKYRAKGTTLFLDKLKANIENYIQEE